LLPPGLDALLPAPCLPPAARQSPAYRSRRPGAGAFRRLDFPSAFAAPDATLPNGAAARLFGATAPGITGAALANGVRLTGIYAGPEAGGFASFQTPAGARGVFPGQEAQSGVVLSSLHPDHVVVLVGGLETRLLLRPPSLSPSQP